MKKKIIASALILVMLGASVAVSYADYIPFPNYIYSIDANEEPIEIISPKEDVIVQDSLLISVKVRKGVSVSLSVYKEDEEESLILGPEEVEAGESLNFYDKQLKDLLPGEYRIMFDIVDEDGNEKEPVIKCFTIKDKKEELNKTLESTKVTNIRDNILEQNND